MKRSYKRILTPHCKILRFMRNSRKISMRKAGALLQLSGASINHYEHGRMDIPEGTIPKLVMGYGYTMDEYSEYLAGKPIPVLDMKEECISLLSRIDASKLRAVHAVLTSFSQ